MNNFPEGGFTFKWGVLSFDGEGGIKKIMGWDAPPLPPSPTPPAMRNPGL